MSEDTGARSSPGPQLIAYADRLGGDIAALQQVLDESFAGAFTGVHVLPFFSPYDGADAGFDPEDHANVDPRLGGWDDVSRLAEGHTVMADLIVNHMSSASEQFQRYVAEGDDAAEAPMFLTMSSLFPDGASEEDLARIYRPRPGLPFTPMTIAGQRRLVWTTFTAQQIDLDVRTPQFWDYLTSVVDALVGAGVTMLRLDAVGYTGKTAGTDCFMTEASFEVVERIAAQAHANGAQVLLEVHGHHELQVEIARTVDYVYDFALPPLLLHAVAEADPAPLASWLDIRPANSISVLDTHDGIGIVDVGASDTVPPRPGLLAPEQLDQLVETIHTNSGGTSRLASGAAASNLDLYQVNSTYYDALGRDDDALLVARLVQLFLPGVPQVYYVGLLAGSNDMDLLARSGVGRDVNRTHVSAEDLAVALERPVVRRQLAAIRLRAEHPAFAGAFSWHRDDAALDLAWDADGASTRLTVDFSTRRHELVVDGVRVDLDVL